MPLSWQAQHHAPARIAPVCITSWSHTCCQSCLFVLTGLILRSTIVKLLQHRIGLFTADANGDIPPAKSHIPTTQQVLVVMSVLLRVSLLQWQVLETLEVLPQQVLDTLGAVSLGCLSTAWDNANSACSYW